MLTSARRSVLIYVLVGLFAFLAGCSGDDDPSSPAGSAPASTVGVWRMYRVTENGTDVDWRDYLEYGAPNTAVFTIEVFEPSTFESLEKDAAGIVLWRETGALEFEGTTMTYIGKNQNGSSIPDRVVGPMNWSVVNDDFIWSGDQSGNIVVLYFARET